uniref:Gfo/Idh/MocA-like oxidoreductase N-terminal domain-containing protein n=1 Tax=Aplanochytrium stocchinoi TaxID=215587 RepID=A0A7S3PH51_9STRA|mmetsp:Transcript_3474/g.4144  ORF Transcript_3474/g.4144 Transcript_3474/m.4144 type:complete len:354 (-) Transcript_3474:152-1213(-)|eukprot:CAMPEP_0204829204 /NCGR_PEP_ID=MMETSP1346-20131115/7268_1 /ASSEMBLY_ACC=CAM_ASM_000771 /TAXON_ID=215587 /ORGANISM="Aplanochytrium stocchinoi, Strain GSBS06" /LENGTH=353 /DNA_ID=CAMNT_0051958791 /DNA_START=138 /DNA_END=1199 /DNA_ORIENTATION=-
MLDRLRVCVVGAGRMGQLRAKILYGNPRVKLQYVVDVAEDWGRKVAALYEAEYAESFHKVDKSKIDAVVICVGTEFHGQIILQAADNGIAIFCEKPIDGQGKEISRLFAYCKEKSVPLCCGFQRRFDKSYAKVREQVVAGKIGTPVMARVFFADHPPPPLSFLKSAGGDPFIDLAPHDLDFICWCLNDEPLEIQGTASSSDPELAAENVVDTAMITIKFKKGCLCNIFMSRSSNYGYDQRCELFGTDGVISVENPKEDTCVSGTNTGFESSKLFHSFPQRFREAFESEMESFVDTVTKRTPWPVTEDDCVAAQEIAIAASASNALGAKVIYRRDSSESASKPKMPLQEAIISA